VPKPYELSEAEIQAKIIEYLEGVRVCHWRSAAGGRRRVRLGKRGQADIFVLRPGLLICLEVKDYRSVQSREQKEFEVSVKKAGHQYFIVRSLEDAQEVLR
jgi:hypothetical protein